MQPPPPISTLFPYTTLFRSITAAPVPRAKGPFEINAPHRIGRVDRRQGPSGMTGPRPPPRRCHQSMPLQQDRKSTRLNSSHGYISYAVFCLKKKKKIKEKNN